MFTNLWFALDLLSHHALPVTPQIQASTLRNAHLAAHFVPRRTTSSTGVKEEKGKGLSTAQDMHEVISTELVSRQGSQLPLQGRSCAKNQFLNIPTGQRGGWHPATQQPITGAESCEK